jgi:hypothetical protein
MLYYSESTDTTFYVNTKIDGGLDVDIKVRQEGNEAYDLEATTGLNDGGYYQSITLLADTIEDNLTANTTYDFLIYSGDILVYTDKLGYKLTGGDIEYVSPAQTNNDFTIL